MDTPTDLGKNRKGLWYRLYRNFLFQIIIACVAVDVLFLIGKALFTDADAAPASIPETVSQKPETIAPPKAELHADFRGDEAYLLTRLLETCYEQWPADISDPNAFFAATQSLRTEARRLKARAEGEGHDSIARLFGEYLQLLDTYVSFLERLGLIQANVQYEAAQAKGEAAKQAIGGVVADIGSGSVVSLDSAAVSVAMAGLNYGFEAWQANGARDAKLVSDLGREVRQMTDRFQMSLEKARATVVGIGAARNWDRGEIGWALDAVNPIRAVAPNDYRTLARELSRLFGLRPRDPFVRLGRNAAQALAEPYNASDLRRLAEDCLDATNLFPDVDAYADYRAFCVHSATVMAVTARHAELVAGASIRKPSPTSARALELAELTLKLRPADSDGMLRLMLATAYLGEGRVEDARREAEQLRHLLNDNTVYQGILASIYAQGQQWDKSLAALRLAVRDGTQPAWEYYRDAYLQPLRKARADEFKKIVTPQWSWDIAYGFIKDDVKLKNDSLYPLTGVKLELRLQQDERKWDQTLEVPFIMPGATHTWEKVFSIPGSRLSHGEAILSCDQNADSSS